MLVLTRHNDQRIIISTGNEVIIVTVVEIGYGKVRLGIDAPPHVAIDREEIALRKRGEEGWT
jgi:carbon storage regulator